MNLLSKYVKAEKKEWTFLISKYVGPSIRDRVHRNENFVEIISVFSTFSNFFEKKKNYKSHYM